MRTAELATFVLYLVGMLGIGVWAWRRTRDLSDYILGGRSLGGSVAALSAGASDMSGWLLLGLPGAMYATGMSGAWIAIGLSVGAWLNWQFVASRLRRFTEAAGDSITLPDYLERRFGDRSRTLRVTSAVVILVFFTLYTASGLVGGAILFENSFGLPYRTALLIGTAVIVSYTFLGGFLAVTWTDFFQGLLMLAALLFVPVVAMRQEGGWGEMVSRAAAVDPAFLDIWTGTTALGVVSLVAWGLGYFGQPHILARFMAVKSEAEIPKARFVGMSWMVLSLYGALFTGFIGIGFFADAPLDNRETVFITLAQTLFDPWVSGVVLAAILAAIMSTVDSQLLVCGSAIAEDFYRGLLRPRASQRELVWVGRGAVLTVAAVALLLATDRDSLVLELVAYAWAGFGAAFGPVVILSLFWRRMTWQGALAGMVVGAATVLVWKQLEGGLFEVYEIVPGFLLAGLAVWVGSLLSPPPPAEAVAVFAHPRGGTR